MDIPWRLATTPPFSSVPARQPRHPQVLVTDTTRHLLYRRWTHLASPHGLLSCCCHQYCRRMHVDNVSSPWITSKRIPTGQNAPPQAFLACSRRRACRGMRRGYGARRRPRRADTADRARRWRRRDRELERCGRDDARPLGAHAITHLRRHHKAPRRQRRRARERCGRAIARRRRRRAIARRRRRREARVDDRGTTGSITARSGRRG